MSENVLIQYGFIKQPHKMISPYFVLNVGRHRQIRVSAFGTPNEVVFISQTNYNTKEEDLICVHNYDYDGYLTESKLNHIVSIFK